MFVSQKYTWKTGYCVNNTYMQGNKYIELDNALVTQNWSLNVYHLNGYTLSKALIKLVKNYFKIIPIKTWLIPSRHDQFTDNLFLISSCILIWCCKTVQIKQNANLYKIR